MHATLRRLKCQPGKAGEVADLIRAEYIPQLAAVDGVVSYTLVDVGGDEVTSLGIFSSQEGAVRANELARAWWGQNQKVALAAAPLAASDGPILLHSSF